MERLRTKPTIVPRSHLYVPADRPDHLAKVLGRGADGIIIDFEDAVTRDRKPLARQVAAEWLAENPAAPVTVWVRLTVEEPQLDLEAVVAPVEAVMVPKAEVESVTAVGELLGARETALGLAAGSFAIVPLIETARGLLAAPELAALPRVSRLAIGRADLAGELGLSVDPDGPEFRSLMLGLVVASSAARIAAPLAPTSTDFRDLEALRTSTEQLLRLGFRGRTAVHPAQLAIINEVFTPSDDAVARATELVDAFERAERDGSGVFADDEGRMIDAAVVKSARDILSRARRS
jgi:citrate lyase subunit beta/citryl-CoA lyase